MKPAIQDEVRKCTVPASSRDDKNSFAVCGSRQGIPFPLLCTLVIHGRAIMSFLRSSWRNCLDKILVVEALCFDLICALAIPSVPFQDSEWGRISHTISVAEVVFGI